MPKAKGNWSIRSVKKLSKYINRTLWNADVKHFKRISDRSQGKQARETKRAIEKYLDSCAKYATTKTPSKLHGRIIANIMADIALKSAGAKEQISAKDFPKLLRTTKNYSRTLLTGNERLAAKALNEIEILCGVPQAKRIEKEVDNVFRILAGLLPPEKI